MIKSVEFDAHVRHNYSELGNYGKIVSKKLADFIGKKVKVKVELIKDNKKT